MLRKQQKGGEGDFAPNKEDIAEWTKQSSAPTSDRFQDAGYTAEYLGSVEKFNPALYAALKNLVELKTVETWSETYDSMVSLGLVLKGEKLRVYLPSEPLTTYFEDKATAEELERTQLAKEAEKNNPTDTKKELDPVEKTQEAPSPPTTVSKESSNGWKDVTKTSLAELKAAAPNGYAILRREFKGVPDYILLTPESAVVQGTVSLFVSAKGSHVGFQIAFAAGERVGGESQKPWQSFAIPDLEEFLSNKAAQAELLKNAPGSLEVIKAYNDTKTAPQAVVAEEDESVSNEPAALIQAVPGESSADVPDSEPLSVENPPAVVIDDEAALQNLEIAQVDDFGSQEDDINPKIEVEPELPLEVEPLTRAYSSELCAAGNYFCIESEERVSASLILGFDTEKNLILYSEDEERIRILTPAHQAALDEQARIFAWDERELLEEFLGTVSQTSTTALKVRALANDYHTSALRIAEILFNPNPETSVAEQPPRAQLWDRGKVIPAQNLIKVSTFQNGIRRLLAKSGEERLSDVIKLAKRSVIFEEGTERGALKGWLTDVLQQGQLSWFEATALFYAAERSPQKKSPTPLDDLRIQLYLTDNRPDASLALFHWSNLPENFNVALQAVEPASIPLLGIAEGKISRAALVAAFIRMYSETEEVTTYSLDYALRLKVGTSSRWLWNHDDARAVFLSLGLKIDDSPREYKEPVQKWIMEEEKETPKWTSLNEINWDAAQLPMLIIVKWRSFILDKEGRDSSYELEIGDWDNAEDLKDYSVPQARAGILRAVNPGSIDVDVLVPKQDGAYVIRKLGIATRLLEKEATLVLPVTPEEISLAPVSDREVESLSGAARLFFQYDAELLTPLQLQRRGISIKAEVDLQDPRFTRWVPAEGFDIGFLPLPTFLRTGSESGESFLLIKKDGDALCSIDLEGTKTPLQADHITGSILVSSAFFDDDVGREVLEQLGIGKRLIEAYGAALNEAAKGEVKRAGRKPGTKDDKVPAVWSAFESVDWDTVQYPVPVVAKWNSFLIHTQDGESNELQEDISVVQRRPGLIRSVGNTTLELDVMVQTVRGTFEVRSVSVNKDQFDAPGSIVLPGAPENIVLAPRATEDSKLSQSEIAKIMAQFDAGLLSPRQLSGRGIRFESWQDPQGMHMSRWVDAESIDGKMITAPAFVRFPEPSGSFRFNLLVEKSDGRFFLVDSEGSETLAPAFLPAEMLISPISLEDSVGRALLRRQAIPSSLIEYYKNRPTRNDYDAELFAGLEATTNLSPNYEAEKFPWRDEPKSKSVDSKDVPGTPTQPPQPGEAQSSNPIKSVNPVVLSDKETRLEKAKEFFQTHLLPKILIVRKESDPEKQDWSVFNIKALKEIDGFTQACGQFGNSYKDWRAVFTEGSKLFIEELGSALSAAEMAALEDADKKRVNNAKRDAHLIYSEDKLEELKVDLKTQWSEAIKAYYAAEEDKEKQKQAFSIFHAEKLFKNQGIVALAVDPATGKHSFSRLMSVIGATTEDLFLRSQTLDAAVYSNEELEHLRKILKREWKKAVEANDFTGWTHTQLKSRPGYYALVRYAQGDGPTDFHSTLKSVLGATEEEIQLKIRDQRDRLGYR